MRSFALKNFTSYARHPQGPEAIAVIIEIFLDALTEATGRWRPGPSIIFWDFWKDHPEITPATWTVSPGPERIFRRLTALPDRFFFLLASSHMPLKRIAQALLRKVPGGRVRERLQSASDPQPADDLRILAERGGPPGLAGPDRRRLPPHPGKGGGDPSRHFPSPSAGIPAGSGRNFRPRRIRGNPAEAPRPSGLPGNRPRLQGNSAPFRRNRKRFRRGRGTGLLQKLEDSGPLQNHGDPGAAGHPRGNPAGDQLHPRATDPKGTSGADGGVSRQDLFSPQVQRGEIPPDRPAVHPGDRRRSFQPRGTALWWRFSWSRSSISASNTRM